MAWNLAPTRLRRTPVALSKSSVGPETYEQADVARETRSRVAIEGSPGLSKHSGEGTRRTRRRMHRLTLGVVVSGGVGLLRR